MHRDASWEANGNRPVPIVEISPYTGGKRATDNCILRVLEKPLLTETFTAMAAMPGFKKWEGRLLVFRPVLTNVQYILAKWPEAQWLEGTSKHLVTIKQLERDAARVIQIKTGPLPAIKAGGYQYKRFPREHQRRALLMSWDREAFALLMEQRTGKTKVVIDTTAYLHQLGRVKTLIIVTLNGVHRNWIENEIPEDLPDWVHRETFFMRANHNKKRQEQFDRALNFKGLRIFSFNVEALSREGKARELFEKAIGDGKGVMLAIDESSDCIKTYGAKRTEYLIKVGAKAKYRRILTGTQSPEGRPDELFPQYLFLSPNILGYDTITTFRAHFCEFVPMKMGEKVVDEEGNDLRRVREIIVPGCKNVEELRSLIDGHSYRVRRSDCMDLPPKVYKRWPVELSKEQRRLYDELKEEYITEYRGKTLTAALAMTRMMRLQQIICGWFPMDEPEMIADETWRNIQPIDKVNPRMVALDDVLQTNDDKKVIIWARFRPDLEAIQKHLGARAVSYHGGIKEEQKAKNKRAFQNDRDVDYMIGNPSSGLARGHNFSFATLLVYFSNSYKLIDRSQSEDRAEGNEARRESTLVIDLEAVGTVDSKIIRRLRVKKDLADLINGDPKSLFLEEDN